MFIQRVVPSPIPREVKRADLRDSSDLSRILEPTERDRERIKKCGKAIAYLEQWAYAGGDAAAGTLP